MDISKMEIDVKFVLKTVKNVLQVTHVINAKKDYYY